VRGVRVAEGASWVRRVKAKKRAVGEIRCARCLKAVTTLDHLLMETSYVVDNAITYMHKVDFFAGLLFA